MASLSQQLQLHVGNPNRYILSKKNICWFTKSFYIFSGNIRCVNNDDKHKQPNNNINEHGQQFSGDEHKQRQRHKHEQLEQPDQQQRQHGDREQPTQEKKEKHKEKLDNSKLCEFCIFCLFF